MRFRRSRKLKKFLGIFAFCYSVIIITTYCTENEYVYSMFWNSEDITEIVKENSTENINLLKHYLSLNNTRIPKILHQVFKSDSPYENYKPFINSCLTHNPDWKYFLWRDQDAEEFIKTKFPSFSKKFKSYNDALKMSDSIRYIVLYFMGGVYLDMDVECVKPIPKWLTDLPAFLDQERLEQTRVLFNAEFAAMNSAMGSAPGHPFFMQMVRAMQNANANQYAGFATGPQLLTRVFSHYRMSNNMPNVTLLSPHVMSPMLDPGINMTDNCSNNKLNPTRYWSRKGCQELQLNNFEADSRNNDTVCVHRFLHLGHSWQTGIRKRPFNLRKEFGNRIQFWSN